jgi:hypothetical protein
VWEDISGAPDILNVGKFQMPSASEASAASTSTRPAKRVGTLSGGERTPAPGYITDCRRQR